MENDALQYAAASRYLYNDKTIDIYPFVGSYPQTGYYASSSHPLGYYSLIVWSYIVQGSSEEAGLMKLITPIHALYLFVALLSVLSNRKIIYGFFSILLLVSTPIFYIQCYTQSIDLLRIFLFFLAFLWLRELLCYPSFKSNMFLGFIVGMSMFSHSLGILTLPFIVLVYFLKSRDSYTKRIAFIVLIVVVSFIFGGTRYLSNYLIFGTPIESSAPVFQLKDLGYQEYFTQLRSLNTLGERILYGVLQGFTKFSAFGLTYWVFILAFVFSLNSIKSDDLMPVFSIVILMFYTVVFLTALKQDSLNLAHSRYYLTVQPFIAYGGALFLGDLHEKFFTP